MSKLLSDKITMIIGGTGVLGKEIVKSFLKENATVIVPAQSSDDILELKQHLLQVTTGKLIPFLTDLADYSKASEISTEIIDEFGRIDLAVTALDNCSSQTALSKLEITDWYRMIEQNINPFFVSTRIILSILKDKTSMYVTISNIDQAKQDNKNVLSSIAASLQGKMAEIISSELPEIKARYHHIFLHNSIDKDYSSGKQIAFTGDLIVQLYLAEDSKQNAVFLNFPPILTT